MSATIMTLTHSNVCRSSMEVVAEMTTDSRRLPTARHAASNNTPPNTVSSVSELVTE